MKKLLIIIISFVVVVAFAVSCEEILLPEENLEEKLEEPTLKSTNTASKSYIVVLEDAELNTELLNLKGYEKRKTLAAKAASKVLKRANIVDGQIGHTYGTAIKGFSIIIAPGQLKKLENDPAVKYVEEDKILSLVKPESINVSASLSGETIPYGITRVKGGASYTGDGVAWVLDTGIDQDHPDLNVDTQRSMSVFTRGRDESPEDKHGHGTHVAGTIAAKNDGSGVVGVAAGATVVAVKVLNSRGSGTTSGVIAGIDYVAANASTHDVANMSLGGGVSTTLDNAVLNASNSCRFSLAAGNDGNHADYHSPARTNGANIYTISGCDINDNWYTWSNYGNPPVDYCEPGVSVYSCYKDSRYATMTGTSMAAPHMAGILLWGDPATDGAVNGDPDGNADPIGIVKIGTTPSNNPPVADFTFTTSELSAYFTDASTDSDGTIASWSWDFGDGAASTAENPSHTYSAGGSYTVTLTVTDNGGITDSFSDNVAVTAPSTGGITLSVDGYKVKGRQKADLTWSGASGTSLNVFRDGTLVATTNNDGFYTDNINRVGGGSYTYTVCETVGSECSNEATIVF